MVQNTESQKRFEEAVVALQQSPRWKDFYGFFEEKSKNADARAIMSDTNRDLLTGRARGCREVLDHLYKRNF